MPAPDIGAQVMTEASLSCQPDKSSLLALLPFLTDTVEPRSR